MNIGKHLILTSLIFSCGMHGLLAQEAVKTEETTTTTTTTTQTTSASGTTTTTVSGTTTTVSGQTGKVTLAGDVNLDKIVDVSDAVLLARFVVGDKVNVTDQGQVNGEMDDSGKLDSEDVILIVKKIVA